MNRRTCPGCGGRSYSSYSGTDWDCPYCGKNLGHVPNELSNSVDDYREMEIEKELDREREIEIEMELEIVSNILYAFKDAKREEYDSTLV